MAKMQLSTKRIMIGKANTRIVAYTAVAAFSVIFVLVASKALISEAMYQNRVIDAKKQAVSQLKTDISSTANLVTAYKAFVNQPQNVLAGNPSGNGPQDGDNAKIVLDALPSKYDFPAVLSSLDYFFQQQNVQIQSVTGTDQEATQSNDQSSGNPKPIPMPFVASVNGNYQQVQSLLGSFNSSIRPFQIQTLQLSGDQTNLALTINAQTFYQPEKTFSITKKAIQ